MALKLLITPLARGAFFGEWHEIAIAELQACFGVEAQVEDGAQLSFLTVDLPLSDAPRLARLACVQGIFEVEGELLRPVPVEPPHLLPDELVWGAKYRGKTHELLTQLAMNLALAACEGPARRLLDPMAGQGTTLLWALRYGLDAQGIELEASARDHLHRHLKRQAKLHRLKHQTSQGSAGPKRKDGSGRYLEARFGGNALRLVTGDSRDAPSLVGAGRYDILVTDIPYGVQHVGRGGTRDPTALLRACVPAWARCLRPGGAMVVAFNRLLPAREVLAAIIADVGLQVAELELPHRMSESIWRDVLVATMPE